jgi:hypothetical protein
MSLGDKKLSQSDRPTKNGGLGLIASMQANKSRGVICDLCSKKFHVSKMLTHSFKTIDAQNMALNSISTQYDAFVTNKEEQKQKFDLELKHKEAEMAKMDPEIQ